MDFFPVSPSDERTWPGADICAGATMVLLDVTPPAALMETYKGCCESITVIDHHPGALTVSGGCHGHVNMDRCAAWLTHEYLWPHAPIPEWLKSIDRVDRWTGVTLEDQYLREVLHPIARLGVSHSPATAFAALGRVIHDLTTTPAAVYAEGKLLYDIKMAGLDKALDESHHMVVEVDFEYADAWDLPAKWLGYNMFVIDTSEHKDFDTTASSQRIFDKFAGIDIFINYRLITWHSGSKYAFHARGRDGSMIDLTDCKFFQGHRYAAGGQRPVDGSPMPFVLDQETVEA
jgi:hypothetical protein